MNTLFRFALFACLMLAMSTLTATRAQSYEIGSIINESPLMSANSMVYTGSNTTVTEGYNGYLFCHNFGTDTPYTNIRFLPTHGTFTPPAFSFPGVSSFVYKFLDQGLFGTVITKCPYDNNLYPSTLLCGNVTDTCLYADPSARTLSDMDSLFRNSFDNNAGGSYVKIQSITRPTPSNFALTVTVNYVIPGTNAGLPALSYVSEVENDAGIVFCPTFGDETFTAISTTQTFSRTYNCVVTGSTLPPIGSVLMAFALFPQPGSGGYTPKREDPQDNLVFVKM